MGFAHAVVAVGIMLPVFSRALHPIGISMVDVGRQLARPLLGAAAAGTAGVLTVHVLGEGFAGLAVGGLVIVAVYAAVGAPPAELRALPGLVRRRRVEVAPAGE